MSNTLPSIIISCDLGQVNDYTALAVVERRDLPTGRTEHVVNVAAYFDGHEDQPRVLALPQTKGQYDIVHLERLPLGTPYTDLPPRLRAIEARVRQRWVEQAWAATGRAVPVFPAEAPVAFVVDQTGVGRPVVDLLREAGLFPVAVTITGGDQTIRAGDDEYRVPKRNLVGAVQAAMQAKRLRAAAALPEWPALRRELTNFKARISVGGHDSYGAGAGEDWREGTNDDLVLAVALACWYGEHELGGMSLEDLAPYVRHTPNAAYEAQ